jgi:glycosyltransferase involved in cell wall biosynthesis
MDVILMRVLYLQPQPCIRALKLAKGLRWVLGEDVSIVFGYLDRTLTELYGYGDEVFDEFVKLIREDPEKSISELAERHKPHIIHSHNAPDFLTVSAINAVDDIPIIHDTHDALTMRKMGYYAGDDEDKIQEYAEEEMIANKESNGRLYVTEGVGDYIRKRYRIDPEPELVFHNYVSRDLIPVELDEKLSSKDGETHIAYAGTITSKIEGHHYDLREIFREIARNRLHIHIYASREDEEYRQLADESRFIHYHGHLDQRVLLQELTKYDFGWAGFNDVMNKEHLDVALPNKAFEYIACGLPVLTLPHKTLSEFVEEHKVGLVINSFDDVKDQLWESNKIKEIVIKKRYEFTIENNINQLIQTWGLSTNNQCNFHFMTV